jgi:peptidase M24-like protein
MTVLDDARSLDTSPRWADRAVKRARLLELLDRSGAEAILLTTAASVNWYLDGARTHVSLAAAPVVAVEVNPQRDVLHVTANERARLLDEELPPGLDFRVRDWWEPISSACLGEAALEAELRALRSLILPGERARFAQLGHQAAAALTEAVTGASPRMSEFALASKVHASLVERELEPVVVLVGGERRAAHRHPLPTTGPLGQRAMVVVCARYRGLIANLTRWIRFGAATSEEADQDRRILEVEADAFAATRAGASLSDVLAEIAAAYPRHGFATNEWTRHHQGGIAGYDGRDPRATPSAADTVPRTVHVAWNPSAPGAKVEDTVLIEDSKVTPLTIDPSWPTEVVRGVARPSVREL